MGDNLYEIPNLVFWGEIRKSILNVLSAEFAQRVEKVLMTISMKCKILFSGEIRKNIINMSTAEFCPESGKGIGDHMHEMSNPVFGEKKKKKHIINVPSAKFSQRVIKVLETICMKCQILFSGANKKNHQCIIC